MTFEDIVSYTPYELNNEEKSNLLSERLSELTELHRENCDEYKRITDLLGYSANHGDDVISYIDLPFLPVRLFKELNLKSIPDSEVVKTMTSSGTTGQAVSKIYLDRVTSANQQKAMVKIVSDFTGSARMPMIIIDCPSVVKDRAMFSARGAGILGFSIFGRKKVYAPKDDMSLDVEEVRSFIDEHKDERILLFGFTFMIWQHFYKELLRLKDEGVNFDLSNAVLIHGGGWKKLETETVSRDEFHRCLEDVCSLTDIHDYYGMVEQTGCIYMECECGHLHASNYSDVIVRRAKDFSIADIGEKGIIQVVSTIPESYPGHSLLTEDEGVIDGIDDCPCGRKGKYFRILGRIKKAEIRGCSDTYGAKFGAIVRKADDEDPIDRITFLVGDRERLKNMKAIPPLESFSDNVKGFLDDLSKELMHNPEAKGYSDVVTLGFWLRRGSIDKLNERFGYKDENKHIGRGIAFHIAPSNVPVNFAYSLFAGLLSGCSNIVRIPSKDFPQVRIIADAVNKALDKHTLIKDYICLVRYERDKDVNDAISEMCDARIIWGGDKTIEDIRRSIIPPRAVEITFADRYSLAVLDSDIYLAADNKERIASDFYNDTYLSDQNACTSPRAVVWTGNHKDEAKEVFWSELQKLVEKKYEFQDVMAVDKLDNAYQMAASTSVSSECKARLESSPVNLIVRVHVDKLDKKLMDYRGNCGFFYEYDCKDIMEIRDFCNDTHCQTIGLLGDSEIIEPLIDSGIKGVDRVVPIGHTMDFDLNWDGYNLVDSLSRVVANTIPRKNAVKVLIFDIDGTLFDTKNGIFGALKKTLDSEGISTPDEGVLQTFIGPPIKTSLIKHYNMKESEAERVTGEFRKIYEEDFLDGSKPYLRAVEAVKGLREKGYKVSIATMKPMHQVKRLLENNHMADLFEHIEAAAFDGSKTKAMMIQNIQRKYGASAKNLYMIGDTEGDYNAAKEAGAEFVGALFGYGFEKDKEYEFKGVRDLTEIADVIKNNA